MKIDPMEHEMKYETESDMNTGHDMNVVHGMSKEHELSDFFYEYPRVDDPNIQKIIGSHRELIEISKYTGTGKINSRGLLPYQEMIVRYMLQYNEILLFWSTGVGKTCGSVGPAEQLIHSAEMFESSSHFLANYVLPRKTHIQSVYLITKTDFIKEENIIKIVEKCSNMRYLTESTEGMSNRQKIKIYNKLLRKYYRIETLDKFVGRIFHKGEGESDKLVVNEVIDSKIKSMYKNSLIIIDEAHDIIPDDESMLAMKKIGDYKKLYHILHTIEKRKVILQTATPMINRVSTMKELMNLILPLDNQMPETLDLNTITLEEFEKYARGRISFLTQTLDNVVINRRGMIFEHEFSLKNGSVVPSRMILYPSYMSEFQSNSYVLSTTEAEKDPFLQDHTSASNFVFPDGSYGSYGFSKYMHRKSRGQYAPNSDFKLLLKKKDNIKKYSSKFYTIADICSKTDGKSFCFLERIYGSGGIMLGTVLEYHGFEKYSTRGTVFSGNNAHIIKAPRYVHIIGETTPEARINILETFNHPLNIKGEYIKVLIGSIVTMLGISFTDVVAMHIVSPEWNEPKNRQAEGRAIRTNSHILSLEAERRKMISKGRDPSLAKVEVNFYRHVAVPINFPEDFSADIKIYRESEHKDILTKRIERMIKKVAFDCQLHIGRNVQSDGKDFSIECDYSTCFFNCFSPTSEGIINDAADILYSSEKIEKAILDIFSILQSLEEVSIEDLFVLMPHYSETIVIMTIERIIRFNLSFPDRFGRRNHVYLHMNILKSSPNILKLENSLSLFGERYGSSLNVIKDNPKIETYMENEGKKDKESFDIFRESVDPTDTFLLFRQDTRVSVFENILVKTFNNESLNDNEKWLISKLKNFYLKIPEPIEFIKIVKSMAIEKTKSSSTSETLSLRAVKDIPKKENLKTGKVIIVHFFKSYDSTNPHFNCNILKCRIYKNENWISCTNVEDISYNEYYNDLRMSLLKPSSGNLIIGLEFPFVDTIRIVNNGVSSKDVILADNFFKRTTATSLLSWGRVCKTIKKPDIFSLLYYLDIEQDERFIEAAKFTDRQKKVKYLTDIGRKNEVKNLSEEQIDYIYSWKLSESSTQSMCDIIRIKLKSMGALVSF